MKIIPFIVNVELTNRCNMECVFCDHQNLQNRMRIGDLEESLLCSVLESIAKFKIYELGIVGLGEPLLDRNLEGHLKTISKYKESFTRISLNSNGTLMDEDKTRIILNSPVNLITFSLNATSPQSYETLMRRDLFNTTVENIKNFIESRKKYKQENMNVSIQFMSSDLNEEDQMHKIFKGYLDDKVIVYNRYVFNKPVLEKTGKGLVNVNKADFGKRYPCWSMYSRVYIDIDGNAYPCTIGNDCYREGSDLCIGNIKRQNLVDIFNNKKMMQARSDSENNKRPFPECKWCTAWELFPNNFEYVESRWAHKKRDEVRREALDRKD